MRFLLAAAILFAACIDGAQAPADLSAVVDMTPPGADLYGVDFAGDYNCLQLNMCETQCDQRNLLCLTACHNMATPSAQMKDQAVQQCFNQFCPDTGVCMLDAGGKRSAACMQCLANAQLSSASACTPTTAAECHACVTQVTACKNDL